MANGESLETCANLKMEIVAQTARLAAIITQELIRTSGSGGTCVRGEHVRFSSPTTLELRCVNSRIIPVMAFVTQAVAATLSLVPSLRIAWI